MAISVLNSKTIRRGLLGSMIAFWLSFAANAQSSKGHIMGNAMTGDTIVVDSVDGGFHREITTRRDGKYQFRSVSPGRYKVTVKHADGRTDVAKIVVVQVGTTARVK